MSMPGPGSGPVEGQPFCGSDPEIPLQAAGVDAGGFASFFTNFGQYMPRTHCMVDEAGRPDWPWIIALIVLTSGIISAYARIYWFWMRTHRAQDPRDRNHKMFELANIFFWCAVCGYVFSILAFAWPAYRLLAAALVLLNAWSWKFVLGDLKDFKSSLAAKAIERRLGEELRDRNATLERLVEERTAELEHAQQRAQGANEAKSRFLASMSHEIRTPMTAIVGYAELLRDARRDGLKIDIDTALETMTHNATQLLTIVDDILDVSKVEEGRMDIERMAMNPLRLARDVIDLMTPKAQGKNLELRLSIDTPVPASIVSDPTRLRQILINLVSNAVKFTKQGSVSLHLAHDADNEQLRWIVRDTGVGMSPDQVELIQKFEAFTQADASTTRNFGGTGLGLRISSGLATLLGGSISIESEQGRGSTFTASVATGAEYGELLSDDAAEQRQREPLLVSDSSDTDAGDDRDCELSSVRTLVVDDGADNRRLLVHLVESAGSRTATAEDGAEALEVFERAIESGDPFGLVLMDMHMPGMDGYEATSELRSRGHRTPILAVTANAMMNDRQRCLDGGCDDFLSKPVQRDRLIEVSKRLVRHARLANNGDGAMATPPRV